MGKDTDLVHVGEGTTVTGSRPLTTPIYETTTYVFDRAADVEGYQAGHHAAFLYSRYENPTVVAVEEKIARADGAETALLFGSGMAATSTALLGLLKAGDEVVCSAAIYGGTFHLIEDVLQRFGVLRRFVSIEELRDPGRLFSPQTRLVWFESPINPTLRCVDIESIAAACKRADVISIIDNTFASCINQQPLRLGVDISMQSATKYLNGHSDVTAGVLAGPLRLLDPLARTRRLLGGTLDPQPAYLLGRGMKTLAVRVARQNSSALAIAQALEGDPRVRQVFYPGLPSHPDFGIARRQMTGFGGMLCVDVHGGRERAMQAFDRLRIFQRAASLGGVESLCSLPILTSQYGLSEQELQDAGVTPGMLRLSVGLENPEDLIDDVRQALG